MTDPVHYVRTERGHVAYQTIGEGERDLLFLPESFGNLDTQWTEPTNARSLHRLSELGRLIMVDKRGTGLSDPLLPDEELSLETWAHDITCALDAVDVTSVSVIAGGGAGPLAIYLASRENGRTESLVLLGAWAALQKAPDYPIGLDESLLALGPGATEEMWGSGAMMRIGAPDLAKDQRLRAWYASFERQSASPGIARRVQEMAIRTDVRPLLDDLRIPTLVIHRENDAIIPSEMGRYIADRVPGARFRLLPGSSHLSFGDTPLEWLEEVSEFLTGTRQGELSERALRTMLFSDIVDSTVTAARMGDDRWRDLLTKYEGELAAETSSSGGTLVNSLGDGHLVTFERPLIALEYAVRLCGLARRLGLEIRCGLHTGEVELRGDDIAGLGVHLAARVAGEAGPSEILVSRTVADLVTGSRLEFESRGTRSLKGIPGSWELFALTRP